MKPALMIHAIAVLLLINIARSMVILNAPRDLNPLKYESWSPVRVRRSAIVYNKCPTGYKKIPQINRCFPCQQYEINAGKCIN